GVELLRDGDLHLAIDFHHLDLAAAIEAPVEKIVVVPGLVREIVSGEVLVLSPFGAEGAADWARPPTFGEVRAEVHAKDVLLVVGVLLERAVDVVDRGLARAIGAEQVERHATRSERVEGRGGRRATDNVVRVRLIDDGVHGEAEEVVDRRNRHKRTNHVVKQALMIFVFAVLIVAVPAPLAAEATVEPGDEAKRVVLRGIAGGEQIRCVIAAENAAGRCHRPHGGCQESVIRRDDPHERAERSVGGIADGIAARGVYFGEELERIAEPITHMAEQRTALDVRAHVRKAIGGNAAVTAKAREKARILTGVVRNERRSSGVELLLQGSGWSEGREQARLGGRQLGRPRDDEIRLAVAGRETWI